MLNSASLVMSWTRGCLMVTRNRSDASNDRGSRRVNSRIKWNWTFHFSSHESYLGLVGFTELIGTVVLVLNRAKQTAQTI
jgi:hypothetical protein